MPPVFSHENAVFWEFLVNCSSFLRFFFGTCWYNIQKKIFGNKPGTKELLECFFATFVEFLQQIQHFLHKTSFWRREDFHVSFHVLCLLGVHKAKKSKKWRENNKMKIFLLWNIFQKTILNLSKLTSKIVSILYFLWFWPDFFPRFFFEFKKNIKETKKSIIVKNFEIVLRTFW